MKKADTIVGKLQRCFLIILAAWVCVSFTACGLRKAKTPSASKVQHGRICCDVQVDFEERGFTNIKIKNADEKVSNDVPESVRVDKVTVCGDVDYLPDQRLPADSEVIIYCLPLVQEEERLDPSAENNSADKQEETNKQPPSEEGYVDADTGLAAEGTENHRFSVRFLDVGQADAALIECDGHYMLIDGGNKEDSGLIYTVLKNSNISHLDIVVGSHAHEDHIGGLPGAYNYADADLTLCPVAFYESEAFEDFAKYAEQKGGGITVPSIGDSYKLGSATVTVLGLNAGKDTNNTSIVLKVQYGETSFLFTGDAERDAEQVLLDSGEDLSATVLKVGHHGSDTSTIYPFLLAVDPLHAVISVGEGNQYGHPTDDTLSILRDADAMIYRTDLQGDIVFVSDGKEVMATTEKIASVEEIMTPG